MKKILIIRYGTIGDTIFASAFLRELRKNLASAQIDFLADKTAKEVLKNCPYINNIIDLKRKWKDIIYYINLFKNYDTIYFLKNDSFLTLTAFLSRVKNRIGFGILRNKFLTKTSPYKEDRNEIDCYLDLLKISGYKAGSDRTELWLTNLDEEKIKDKLKDVNSKKVIIQAYSRFSQKNWIDDYWVEVIKYLSNEMGVQIFYAGGSKDYELYENLNKKLSDLKIKPINLCGQLSVTESFAFIKNMDLFIGIDSGLIHAAAALDIPAILLNGATSLKRWTPRSDKCLVLSKNFPCNPCCIQTGVKKGCKNQTPKCMLALTPDLVIDVLKNNKLFSDT